ncbi:MAG: hypothetical protein ACHP65_06010 [Legionellales bacterium]
MCLKSDENQALKPKELHPVLAAAGRAKDSLFATVDELGTQGHQLAQYIENGRHVYYVYAALDSLSSSYSMYKYFFDVFVSNNDADSMHDALMTPAGIAIAAAESLFLVSFSLLACLYDGETGDVAKEFIVTAWPYFRAVMKGLKNAYKGWRSAVIAFNVISSLDLKYIITPVGLVLGIVAAINRFFLCFMVEERKNMMKMNVAFLWKKQHVHSLTQKQREALLAGDEIQSQSMEMRVFAFIGVAFGGLVDGLYLYAGVLAVAALCPPMFIAVAAMCIIYTVACVISRIYEEYDFQLRLLIVITKCELVLLTKQLQTEYAQLLLLKEKINKSSAELEELAQLEHQFCKLINEFDGLRRLLQQQSTHTYLTAVLAGIKNSLYLYSALSSILFVVSVILLLSSVAFPPLLLIIVVSTGLALMIGCVVQSVMAHQAHLEKLSADEQCASPYDELFELKKSIEEERSQAKLLEEEGFRKALRSGLDIKPPPRSFIQEWSEVWRSIFSGMSKGQKFIDFSGNELQEKNEQGHYQDTPIMLVLSLFSALAFAVTLGLRALGRGMRPLPGQVDLTAGIDVYIDPPARPVTPESVESLVKTPVPPVTPSQDGRLAKNSDTSNIVARGNHRFFSEATPESSHLHRSSSAPVLNGLNYNNIQNLD